MKIRDILRKRKTGISFEFFPPKSVEGKEGFMKMGNNSPSVWGIFHLFRPMKIDKKS